MNQPFAQTYQHPYPMPPAQVRFGSYPTNYCMECGATLYQGCAFCTECGTMAGMASDRKEEQAPSQTTGNAPIRPSNPVTPMVPYHQYQGQSGGSGAILVVGILMMITAIAFLVGTILLTQGDPSTDQVTEPPTQSETSEEATVTDEDEEDLDAPVRLTKSFTTDESIARAKAYPVFKFSYPASWSIYNDEAFEDFELVSLYDGFENEVIYNFEDGSGSKPYTVKVGNIEKVADSALTFNDGPQDTTSSQQKYAVVKFDVRSSNSPYLDAGESVIAVLPEEVVSKPSSIDFSTGYPSFKRGYNITFMMTFDKDSVLTQRLKEATAILSSFDFVKEIPASDMSLYERDPFEYLDYEDDYIIPYSDAILLTENDISHLSTYELYLARNEIYARYGRMFQNQDLNDYFNSKWWYYPTILPENFSDSMLSQTERDNLQTILDRERSLDSPYL